ncbi:MAG: hypothetical protein RR706_03880 [Muribaculaceae bacterium]
MDIIDNEDFYKFIDTYKDCNADALRLKGWKDADFDVKFAILQIECRKKVASKIPELNGNGRFLYPSLLLAEQCTSQIVAQYHATLFDGCESVLDMTAGLCVDSYYISKRVANVTALEIDDYSAMIDTLNMNRIAPNVKVLCCDSANYIQGDVACTTHDAIFIDPARRGTNNSRVYAISDCNPDIIPLLSFIRNRCKFLIIKASPMIDITDTLNRIDNVSDVWVIGVKNECKELLYKVDFGTEGGVIKCEVHTINFDGCGKQEFSYELSADKDSTTMPLIMPSVGDYLYEPNCCLMKAGSFRELSYTYSEMRKLHNNTHLYVAHSRVEKFPGREFRIEQIIPFKDKAIKRFHEEYPQINVSVRNFKLSANQLKDRLRVRDGGDKYLFGVTLEDDSMALIVATKAIS